MAANALLGVCLHAIGGVAHGSFYVPLRKLRHWRWETGWLVQGSAAWLVAPWLVAIWTGTHLGCLDVNSRFCQALRQAVAANRKAISYEA